jgi:DNA transformation protein
MDSLQQMPNIGAILAERLRGAGVADAEELRRLGAGRAFEKIRAGLPPEARAHTLLALEGAIRGTRWTAIPRGERDALVHRFLPEAGPGARPVTAPQGSVRPPAPPAPPVRPAPPAAAGLPGSGLRGTGLPGTNLPGAGLPGAARPGAGVPGPAHPAPAAPPAPAP